MVLVLKQLCRIASTDVAELGEMAVIDKQPTNANINPCRIPDSTGVTTIGNCLQNETCQSAAAPQEYIPVSINFCSNSKRGTVCYTSKNLYTLPKHVASHPNL